MMTQNAHIVMQPDQDALGECLVKEIENGEYATFRFAVAYARMSGVNLLKPYLEEFKGEGRSIIGTVGIDQRNTSIEAIRELMSLCDRLFVFHNENPYITFHDKAYMLESDDCYWLAIGSNNMTEGGLLKNDEACIILVGNDLPPQNMADLFAHYTNTESPYCLEVDGETLKALETGGYVLPEADLRKASSARKSSAESQGSGLFASKSSDKGPGTRSKSPAKPKAASSSTTVSDEEQEPAEYMMKYAAKGGGRAKQVQFNMDIQKNFFHLENGEEVSLQEMRGPGASSPARIERRVVVLSDVNRNVRLEVEGATILNEYYPEDPSTKPIILMKRISKKFFRYMLLMPGDDGYTEMNARLDSEPQRGNSFKYAFLTSSDIYATWPGCPLYE